MVPVYTLRHGIRFVAVWWYIFAQSTTLRRIFRVVVSVTFGTEQYRQLGTIRPFLTQSDSASRKQHFSTGHFFDWILLVLIVSRVDFIVFVLFPEVVGSREYCCVAVEYRLAALRFARSPRATRAARATNPCASELVALRLAESHQSYVRGVALSREPPKL